MPFPISDIPIDFNPPRAGDPAARTAAELLRNAAIGAVRLNHDGTVTEEEAQRLDRALQDRGIRNRVDRAHNVTVDGQVKLTP